MEENNNLHIGIDVGSTTVKLAILDEAHEVKFSVYRRHHADVRATIVEVLSEAAGQYLRFLGIAAVGLAINNATIYLLHNRFRLNFYLAKLFATGVVTFWNFFMNYFFTFL